MKNKLLILILGKSSTGKTTMAKQLSHDLDIPICVSCTTRPTRTNEQQGKDYHFISDEEFNRLDRLNEFIEKTSYNIESENRIYQYGYTRSELNKAKVTIAIVNPHGYKSLLNSEFKDKIFSVQIVRDDKERLLSYLNRDENSNVDELIDRYLRDKDDFKDLVTDRIIYNDNYIESYNQLLNQIIEEIDSIGVD